MSGGGEAHVRGRWGEALVAEDLRRKGCRLGELDVVAKNKQYLIFMEVKLRKNAQYGAACEAVTPSKQRKLTAAAQYYLMCYPTELQPRFDVAEVYAPQGVHTEKPDIYYIENAF